MKQQITKFAFALIAALLTVSASAHSPSSVTLFRNADVVTMNTEQASASAVAVRDGRIIAVGSDQDLSEKFASAETIIDLNGQTLLPGFIDAHGHISFTARTVVSPNVASPPVGPANNIDDVITELKQADQQRPGDDWIFGFGYDDSLLAEGRHPTRADLDKVSTERPVGIMHVSAHFLSCNSKCLELAGISAQTPDPDGGIIRREANGKVPNGVLEETAMAAVYATLPQPDEQTRLFLLDKAQDYYAERGITTVQDGASQLGEVALFEKAAELGRLKLDIVAYPVVSYIAEKNVEITHSPSYKNRFRVGGIKLVLDGSPQGKTAWLTQPYLHPPHGQNDEYLGYPILKTEQVQKHIDAAFANNTPVLAHANGDAAADQLIEVVKSANKKFGAADRRTVMIHAQTAREDQIDDMLAAGIMPSYFSAHTFYWGDWHRDSVFGKERAERISPLRSSVDKGLKFTTHNDTPVVPADMLRLLWASVNRQTRSGKTLGAAQKITPYEALKSVTIDAAYQYFEEQDKGSIEVGKLADFVVLDQNPLTVAPQRIKDLKVMMTFKEGHAVYQRREHD